MNEKKKENENKNYSYRVAQDRGVRFWSLSGLGKHTAKHIDLR